MTAPFDDIRQLLDTLPGPSPVTARGDGRLGEIAAWLGAWSGRSPPAVSRPVIAIYAGGHGVAAHLPEAAPTRGQLEAIAAGLAPVSQAAQGAGAGLDAFDLALDRPVPDITQRAAMSEKEAAATMAFGMEALAKEPDLLILGEIGHGGEVAAAALCCGLFGGDADEWSEHPQPVALAVERAEREGARDPLELLRQLGGREIAAQAGAILAARTQKVPVLIDSFGGCAAAAALATLRPDAADHCMAGQVSAAKGHAEALRRLGLRPLVDLGLTEGSGAGSASAIAIIRLSCAISGG
ncbi:MAG TPA: nicotinate-nucleotide--dimethylbenzimidazole phosphoribosyltransferase [Caulobacteraceae bacterium]|nr:nicotinate-nucleotide--dimethylbenzimidazole phosphoribosyltransferase [Caulobacteraceae bacterium]